MRVLATLMVFGFVAAQATAVEWRDDFDGGFDQSWDFFADDGSINPPSHSNAVINNNALEILGRDSDFPEINLFVAGLAGLTSNPALMFPDAVQVTATFSPTMNHNLSGFVAQGNSDVFLLARSFGASGYVLALDTQSGSFDLVRSDDGDPDNIADGLIVPDYDPNATYVMRLTAEGDQIRGEIFDASMNLILDAFSTDATYTSGFAGLGAAINNNESLGFDRTLVTGRYDNVLATDENIVPMQPFFPATRLDLRSPTATALNVVEVRDLGQPEVIRGVMNKFIATAPANRTAGTILSFDIHDPDNGANAGSVASPQQAILTNTMGADDNDFVQLVSGSFAVPEGAAGDYTFNFHTDDGFAMRIFYDGQGAGEDLVPVPFTRIGSRGIITPAGEVSFPHDTGDSNVQALINLAEGSYSFEMMWFETGGGAFAEVSTDMGDFVDDPSAANWILLGDPTGLALIDGLGTGPLLAMLLGDYNFSGQVEQGDLDLVLLNWGAMLNAPWVQGIVDQAELDTVLLNWGNTAALGGAASVPEPATCWLVLLVTLLAAVYRQGKR